MNSEVPIRLSRFTRTAAALLILAGIPVLACQVPVFRYALERWSADQYRIVVLHEGSLNAEAEESLRILKSAAEPQPGTVAAIDLSTIDVADSEAKISRQMRAAWNSQSDKSKPLMLAYYPSENDIWRDQPAYQCQAGKEQCATLLDSPVRREVAQKLQAGDSAVWIFVPCGRQADDQEALERLTTQLAADADWLQLPTAEELEVEPQVLEKVKVPLQIRFSTVTLSRDDPQEQFLLSTLLNSEEDLAEFDQPLAFPVFGRGRVLYGLVGKGIAAETIRTASAFMAGPCSCQVKNQNPGFDLLLQADWKTSLGDVLISEPIERVDTESLAPKLLTIPPGRKSR